ncbi:MAG TPA: glycerophosphodiester phosphodiesterase family protein [Marmoricola sp.]|jgi:glycerophosphoryl diester phosphodiesterase|nr:glycerophosphodiester phosphodiesterase family protein [Marmoricola sp.]
MGVLTAFDLQAHRGGAGLRPENSLAAFGHALELGVSTLELDVQISLDGRPVISHERVLPDGEFIAWRPAEELGLPLLDEVFGLLSRRGADEARVNVETKFDVVHPDEVAPRERFVDVVVQSVRRAGLVDRTSIQSFDWAVLDLVRDAEAGLALNVLTNTPYLEIGQPGSSPWTAGVDVDDFAGDVAAAASGRGYTALSPSHTIVTPAIVREAHDAGLLVIPYTVDDAGLMAELVDLGVDGLITNRPDLGREVLAARGLVLPRRYPPAPGEISPDS